MSKKAASKPRPKFLTHPMGADSYKIGKDVHAHNERRRVENEAASQSQYDTTPPPNGMSRGNF